MAYSFRVPSGDGSCVCEVCDCTPTLEIQVVPLATLTRDGWDGWDGDLQAIHDREDTVRWDSETYNN